jgi:hypothetical protein
MTLHRTGLTGMAGLAMVVAAAVAGCASSPSSSGSTTTPAAPASSAATSATSAASAPATGSASSGAANPNVTAGGAPACATASLKATVGIAQGAAGSVYQVIDFTNIGGSACTLYGYPGVSLVTGTPPKQIGAAATRSSTTPATLVTLAAGATANALVRITVAQNYPTATCDPVATTALQIYPPNQTAPIYLAYKTTGCSATKVNLLTVSVVQAGAGSGN